MTSAEGLGGADYPVSFDLRPAPSRNRLTVLFRLPLSVPALFLLALMAGATLLISVEDIGSSEYRPTGAGYLTFSLVIALALLLRGRYPKWIFDFLVALAKYALRVFAYVLLLTDRYPSIEDDQDVQFTVARPTDGELNRFLPLIKWVLLVPHYVVLAFLVGVVLGSLPLSWLIILIRGRHSIALQDFTTGVLRWGVRVYAYGFLLATDRYPPFRLQ